MFLCRRPTKQPKVSARGPRWIKDKAVYWCKHCQTDFSLLIRKHHCRHCGQVFCGHCTKNKRALVKFGYVKPVRLCTKCNAMCFKSDLLLNAVALNDLNTVRKICEEGCDVSFTTTAFPPTTIAANRGFSDMVRLLLKHGSDPNQAVPRTEAGLVVQCSSCGKTAAFDSSHNDSKYECPFCSNITRFEEANDSDHTGITALHAAVQKEGHLDCVVALLEVSANVDAVTEKGNTPLMYACAGGHLECARVLIAHGASVNIQTIAEGDVPLHKAIREGHTQLVQLLIDSGADANIPNKNKVSPKQLADRSRNPAMMACLDRPRVVKSIVPETVAVDVVPAAPETQTPEAEIKPLATNVDAVPQEEEKEVEASDIPDIDLAIDSANRQNIQDRVGKWVEEHCPPSAEAAVEENEPETETVTALVEETAIITSVTTEQEEDDAPVASATEKCDEAGLTAEMTEETDIPLAANATHDDASEEPGEEIEHPSPSDDEANAPAQSSSATGTKKKRSVKKSKR